jgi:hypothetical protein
MVSFMGPQHWISYLNLSLHLVKFLVGWELDEFILVFSVLKKDIWINE